MSPTHVERSVDRIWTMDGGGGIGELRGRLHYQQGGRRQRAAAADEVPGDATRSRLAKSLRGLVSLGRQAGLPSSSAALPAKVEHRLDARTGGGGGSMLRGAAAS